MSEVPETKQRKKSRKSLSSTLKVEHDQKLEPGSKEVPKSPLPNVLYRSNLEKPCHRIQKSLLSASSGYTNYRGFFHLSLILLLLSNARVALENIIKYGILVDPVSIASVFLLEPHKSPIIYLIASINLYILPCCFIERKLFDGTFSQKIGSLFYIVNSTSVLTLPALIIFWTEPNPFGACLCLVLHTVVFFKIISYAHVNFYYRVNRGDSFRIGPFATSKTPTKGKRFDGDSRNSSSSDFSSSDEVQNSKMVEYPDNLCLLDMYYFMVAPTLCYELNFPRNKRISRLFVLKRLFEVLFLFQIILALDQQWIVPLLKNSLQPFIGMEYGRILERLLKLAVPNHVIWLITFYWLFHSFLNLIAELLRFADRRFYNDWWNAETIQYFWQNWNVPVHKWCVRHLYLPMINAGYGKIQASCSVFLVSAFFHEYLISVPLHLFRVWAFTGMLAQIPLNWLTTRFLKGSAGNVVVWLSLILGQPLAILMYVHDWYVVHYINKNDTGAHSPMMNRTMTVTSY